MQISDMYSVALFALIVVFIGLHVVTSDASTQSVGAGLCKNEREEWETEGKYWFPDVEPKKCDENGDFLPYQCHYRPHYGHRIRYRNRQNKITESWTTIMPTTTGRNPWVCECVDKKTGRHVKSASHESDC